MSATTGSAAPVLTAAVSRGSRTVSPPSTASFASRAPPTAARSSPPPSPSAARPQSCEARPAPRQRSKTPPPAREASLGSEQPHPHGTLALTKQQIPIIQRHDRPAVALSSRD